MRLKVVAFDLDGTLTEDHNVPGEMWLALRRLKDAGFSLILVTGRTMDLLDLSGGPFTQVFEAVVAENGAVVRLARGEPLLLPFGTVDAGVLSELESRGVPLTRGAAIAATRVPFDREVLEVVGDSAGSFTVEYNKGAVMVLPPGATKGTGLEHALIELGYSPRNLIAVGDGENDRSMFELAEASVAVANAPPEIRELADRVLPLPNGAGVRLLVDDLLAGRSPVGTSRPSRRLHLGKTYAGEPLEIDPALLVDGNVGVVGASGTGKSWLAGRLAELLLGSGYQVCILDPEGEYRGLRAFPHTLLFGGPDVRLPSVSDVVTMCEYNSLSLVVDLSNQPEKEKGRYATELLHGLLNLRARRGRPHWFLLDEAHVFCSPEGSPALDLVINGMATGGFCIVSYSPSQVAPTVLELLDHWLLTGLKLDEEVQSVSRYLADPSCFGIDPAAQLTSSIGRAALCRSRTSRFGLIADGVGEFETERRVVPHVRHLHKYLRAPLPEWKRFYFHASAEPGSPVIGSAASLWEFKESMRELPIEALRGHLERGDFERWLTEVLHDEQVARQVGKLAKRKLDDSSLRDALYTAVANRYAELEALT